MDDQNNKGSAFNSGVRGVSGAGPFEPPPPPVSPAGGPPPPPMGGPVDDPHDKIMEALKRIEEKLAQIAAKLGA